MLKPLIVIPLVAMIVILSYLFNSRNTQKGNNQVIQNEPNFRLNKSLQSVLSTYVDSSGRVDYQAIRDNPFQLYEFIDFIGKVSPNNRSDLFPKEDDQKAYWINAYNALVLMAVIEKPGISSVKDIAWGMGLFWRKKSLVGGEKITLDHIEKQILRKRFRDPRIHFAINCASNSCPPLGNRILTGDNLEKQLNEKAYQFISNENNVRFDHNTKTAWLSRIFKWYKKDFIPTGNTVLKYIVDYLPDISEELRSEIIYKYNVQYFNYDWSLNASDI